MKRLFAILAILPALAWAVPAPLPITVNSQSDTAPTIQLYRGSPRTVRVTFRDGTAAGDLTGTPTGSVWMTWAVSTTSGAYVASDPRFINYTNGVCDFDFSAGDLNYAPGRYIYEVGCTSTVVRQGVLLLGGSPFSTGTNSPNWTTNLTLSGYTINWAGSANVNPPWGAGSGIDPAIASNSFVLKAGDTMTGGIVWNGVGAPLTMSDGGGDTNIISASGTEVSISDGLQVNGAIRGIGGGNLYGTYRFVSATTNTYVIITSTGGVHIGTNSYIVDTQGNVSQSSDLVSSLGTLRLSGTTNRLTDDGTNLLRNGTLISGSGSGSGFPLTSSVSAAGFNLTDAGDLTATNQIRAKYIYVSGVMTGGNLTVLDATVRGNLIVLSNQYITTTVNITSNNVTSLYTTNFLEIYITNNVYEATNVYNSVTNLTNNITLYTTNIATVITNFVSNFTNRYTNTYDTYILQGGNLTLGEGSTLAGSNAASIQFSALNIGAATNATALGTWDFTSANVSGLSIGVTNETDPIYTASEWATNTAAAIIAQGGGGTLDETLALGNTSTNYAGVKFIVFGDGTTQATAGVSGQTLITNLPSGTIFGIDGQNGAATLSRSASIPLIFDGATSVITQITGWTGQLNIASVELFSTSATAFSRSAKLRVRNSANTASRWNGVQYSPVPLVVYGTTIATTTGVGTNGFEATSFTPYDFLFGDSVELVSSGTVTRSVIYSSVTGGVFNVYETFPNYGAEAIVRAIRIYQPGAVYGTNPCLHLELSGAAYTGTVDAVVNFGIQ